VPVDIISKTSSLGTVFLKCQNIRSARLSDATLEAFYCICKFWLWKWI